MPANHRVPHTEEAKAKMSAARRGKPATWKRRPSIELDGVVRYRCGKCGDFLPREGFYTNKRTLLGIKSECRKCHTATALATRDPELKRAANAEYQRRARALDPDRFRAQERAASRRRQVTERTLARHALNAAVKSGRVVKAAACESCAQVGKLHGHHDDYAQPLAVRWLCPACHGKEHRKS